ncbi:MAG: GTP cyclohydrolase I FolE [Dehalococcoidia bacterium]|jgi:GTP cyclohydrolase I
MKSNDNKEMEQVIQSAIKSILESIGEDVNREGLLDTPKRVSELYSELFSGFGKDPKENLNIGFSENHYDPVLLTNISFFSICEHHLLPFIGKVHIGYIPQGKVVGVSKLARVVDILAKRLQIQERLTTQIADTINTSLDALAVLVVISAEHMCMTLRGVEKPGALLTTFSERGDSEGVNKLRIAIYSESDNNLDNKV